ncbi:MAG: RelB/DinJ family addiction module antitoxin, partial [Eggerthellaceae bacterium]|nr:RelB/DinJ family addiction module antitoxin [Eggerthellaceae bacterium]
GNAVLAKEGLNASQAVNVMYDRLLRDQDADFLTGREVPPHEWQSAAKLIDSIHIPINTRFDNMTRGEIKLERAKAKGWV